MCISFVTICPFNGQQILPDKIHKCQTLKLDEFGIQVTFHTYDNSVLYVTVIYLFWIYNHNS